MNLIGFLASCGGKATGKPSEWVFDCWKCQGKEKLYFNIHKLVGYCQKCQEPVTLKSLAFELGGISIKDINKLMEETPYPDRVTGDFKETVLTYLLADSHALAVTPRAITFPPSYTPLSLAASSVIGRKAIAYLEGRGFPMQKLYDMKFGYCATGYYENRVIIPFWEQGRLVYWQARDFSGKVPLSEKILNPLSSSVFIGKSSVLFNIDEASRHETIVVCESWGSALAVGSMAVGINGKSISSVQVEKLFRTPAMRYIVCLDHGAESESWKIAERLSRSQDTLLAFLPMGDPNEVPRSVLLHALTHAIPYSQLNHLRFSAEALQAN